MNHARTCPRRFRTIVLVGFNLTHGSPAYDCSSIVRLLHVVAKVFLDVESNDRDPADGHPQHGDRDAHETERRS
jgi:hypothetical protein